MSSVSKFLQDAKILYTKPFLELSFDRENNILITKWKGTLTLDQVKEGVQFKADFIKEHKTRSNINDHTYLRVLTTEVQQYLIDEGHPLLSRNGLQKIAVLVAKDIFAQATVRQVNRKKVAAGELQIEVFSTYEDAYGWLLA